MMPFSGGTSRPRTAQNSKVGEGGGWWWGKTERDTERQKNDRQNQQMNQSRERLEMRQKPARRRQWAIK